MAKRYWLMKSEPHEFSIDDLAKVGTEPWSGVRNYQVRNSMRDDMHVGDGVLFYHSSADPTGIAGIAEVAREAYPDPTAFDPGDPHYDAKSRPDAPTWLMVDVRAVERFPRLVTLEQLRADPVAAGMQALRRGNRLSITPVTAEEWDAVRRLAGIA